MELELISFKLCPFVQSSIITLKHKDVAHKVTHIDISDPPPWFDEISPLGQVPLLRVDNKHIIFESAVINQYLDEVTGGGMMPDDPLTKALNRSWMAFCGSILGDMFNLLGAEDQEKAEDIEYDIHDKLDRLEAAKTDSSFFNGDELNLIDCSFAGVFMRLNLLQPARDILDIERFPKLKAWHDHLLGLDEVKNSVVPEFNQMYLGMAKKRGGWIGQQLD